MVVIVKFKSSGLYSQWELANVELYPLYVDLVMVIGEQSGSNYSKAVRIAAILNEETV